jgi:hypothetical protein
MKNLDTLIDNQFKNRSPKNAFSLQELLRLVETIYGEAQPLLKEEARPSSMPQTMNVELSFIPEINVSELGWSDVSTDDAGEVIKGPQRRLLEDYLSNVEGSTLSQKVASLEAFYEDGDLTLIEGTQDRSELIKKIMSYLVFYKTLTKVITNFNASSAGFSFESFLATLLDGQQIKANTGTIADFTTGDNIPISLKLYAEKSLEVGGSYVDLVNDLVDPKFNHPGMRYVVCTKNLTGTGLEQNGSIKFYQFDINLDNAMNIISQSSAKSAACIRIPRAIETADASYDLNVSLPSAQNMPSIADMRQIFEKNVVDRVQAAESTVSEEDLRVALNLIDWGANDGIFKAADPSRFGGVSQGVVYGISGTDRSKLKALLMPSDQEVKDMKARFGVSSLNTLLSFFTKANDDLVALYTRTKLSGERGKQIKAMADAGEFLSPEDSAILYETLSPEMRKVALTNSLGYLERYQWHLNRTQATNRDAPLNAEYQGEIRVGQAAVLKLLNDVRDILNQQVFSIFNSLKSLSDNLNGYFAGGLEDDRKASTAIADAQNIETNTTEIKDQK